MLMTSFDDVLTRANFSFVYFLQFLSSEIFLTFFNWGLATPLYIMQQDDGCIEHIFKLEALIQCIANLRQAPSLPVSRYRAPVTLHAACSALHYRGPVT